MAHLCCHNCFSAYKSQSQQWWVASRAITSVAQVLASELSVALYRHLLGLQENEASPDQPVVGKILNLLCCDIDAGLIERAQRCSPFPGSISYATLDVMDASARELFLSSYLSRFSRSTFDICFCMSVTMWIHLNHGDDGLVEFLSYLSSRCNYLLIEPQPWKCYRAAARRLRKLGRNDFDHFRSLAINGDMAERITQILTEDGGMELVCCFGSTSWDRSLLLFKSNRLTQNQPIPQSLPCRFFSSAYHQGN
uniref:RNA methyltransferase n=1 Tax=Gopherus agassizii TaxID=38772 RepID=A0A452H6E1_9SAUR